MQIKPNISFDNVQVAFAAKSDAALKKRFMIFKIMNNNIAVKLGTGLVKFALRIRLPIVGIIKKTVFEQLCGGESISDSVSSIRKLQEFGIGAVLDYSVEGEDDEEGFDHTRDEILKVIKLATSSDSLPFAVFKVTGIGDHRLMSKIQQGDFLSDVERGLFDKVKQRFDQICRAAYEAGIRVMVDGEESWYQDVIDGLVDEAMGKYNKNTAVVYNTYQMYRRGMMRNLRDAHHKAVAGGYYLGAKLVRGAYMEKEAKRALKNGYPNPIQSTKVDTDWAFNEALLFCINNKQRVSLVNGTHNEMSSLILAELMSLHGVKPNDERFYFMQLYGMSDHISYNLAKAGYRVAKYLPYGPIRSVMPYLFRRAAENTSIAGQSSRELDLVTKEMARRKALRKQ